MLAIVWHSRTGAARGMAQAALEGAEGGGMLIAVGDAEPDLMLDARGYLFVCPENLASMSGAMKEMFDRCYYPLLGRIEGRPYATAIAAGSDGRGAQAQIDRIVTGWRLKRVAEPLIVNMGAQTPEDILAEKSVPQAELDRCRELGAALAEGLRLGIFWMDWSVLAQNEQWRLDAHPLLVADEPGEQLTNCGESRGGEALESGRAGGVLSLLYVAGERPGADDVARLLAGPANAAGSAARISFKPDKDEGWFELLTSGLTFDISGLSPAPAQPAPLASHLFGLPPETRDLALEAVTLSPGEHISSGATMLPIIRVMCGLGAGLTSLGNVKAVCWHPAESWIEPAYFSRAIANWLAGGVFPALGLTALWQIAGGSVESMGLGFFTGQEVRIDKRTGESSGDTARLAIRMIDLMVRQGQIQGGQTHDGMSLSGPDGEELLIEPPREGMVRVRRGE